MNNERNDMTNNFQNGLNQNSNNGFIPSMQQQNTQTSSGQAMVHDGYQNQVNQGQVIQNSTVVQPQQNVNQMLSGNQQVPNQNSNTFTNTTGSVPVQNGSVQSMNQIPSQQVSTQSVNTFTNTTGSVSVQNGLVQPVNQIPVQQTTSQSMNTLTNNGGGIPPHNGYRQSMNGMPNRQYHNRVNDGKKRVFVLGGIAFVATVFLFILFLILGRDKNYSRTVMIYMVGSNLESENGLGTVDLDSIDYNRMDNENVNVVLIAGGSKEWDNNYIDENETSIYELTEEGYEKVKTQSIQNMGSSTVLRDFLNYVYDNYKTDKYDLIFWNHGGAILGSEFDDLSGDNLSLEEMKSGLSMSSFNNKKLETVIFRTCLNGTIEIADTFKDYSEYLVASEEITLGTSIASVLNFVNEIETADSGYDVSVKFVNSYKNQINELKQFYGSTQSIYSTYSVIDLSKVEDLVVSLNDFVSDINVSQNYNDIAKVRSNLYQYAYSQAEDPSYDMVDLYNLVDGLKNLSLEKAEKVLENLESAVVYNWATNDNSRGMSIYFPYNAGSAEKKYLLSIYDSFASFGDYNTFISKFYSVQSNATKSYSFTSNEINVSTEQGVSDFTLQLTDEQLAGYARAEYMVFMDKGDGYFYPVYQGNEVTLNGSSLNASINGRHLKILDETGKAVTIPLIETYSEEDYIKYNASVMLQDYSAAEVSDWKIDGAQLSLVLDKKTGEVTVGSVLLNEEDDNKPVTVAVDLKDYQYITFGSMSHKLLDENGNFDLNVYENNSNGVFEGVEISVDEVSDFKLSSFDDENDYYCVFRIYDVNNNYNYSKLVKMN